MRKLLLFTLVATLFTACTEDVIDEQRNVLTDDNRTLTVSLDGDANDTRIQLNEEKKTVWTEGDLLSVFYRSTTNEQWQFMGKTGDRTGNVEPVDSSIIPTPTTNDIVVVYPYNAGYFYNSDTKNVQASLPATQSYLKDSYGLDGNILVSLSEYNQVALKSVCGWLKLQLTGNGEKIKSITLRGNNGEQVAGELYINSADATSTLASKLTESDDDSEVGGTLVRPGTILKEVTLDCGEGVVLGAEATAFYIALPPQTFTKGLTVEITATNGLVMTKSTDNEVVIERNHIKPMTAFVYDGVRPQPNNEIWYTATAKVEPYDKTVFGATYVSNEWDSETGEGVITFDGDVTEIGYYAFVERTSLTSVTIPDSVTTIGGGAFYNCHSLISVTIPDSVTTIGEVAFRNCTSLKEFKGKFAADGGRCLIVDGVLNAFALGCGATQYTIPDSVTTIRDYAFEYCDSLTSVTIPDSVTTIGEYAFFDCGSLISVTIGNSVTTIGNAAFFYCKSLKTVYCKPTTPPTGGSSMFYGNASERKIYVPASDDDSIINAYKAKTYWGDYADCIFEEEPKPANNEIWYTATAKVEPYYTDEFGATYLSNVWDSETGKGVITFEGDVTKIGYYAFYGDQTDCNKLTSVTIPDSVTTIGEKAFYSCTGLTSVNIPDSVTTIGKKAFYECESLTSVTISDSVTTIGEEAFYYCDSLTSVTIGNSVTTIGEYAFSNCDSLTSVTIPDSVTTIGNGAFSSCDSLTSVTIPDSVTTIGDYAFFYCDSLESVTIPDSVTTIGDYAFSDCDSLESVTIPDSVTTIGSGAFRYCDSLESVTIPDSVTTIGNYAFDSCDSLTNVTIPDSVTTIGGWAFSSCDSLTSVTIGDSVTTIGEGAFNWCTSLKEFKGKFAADNGRCLIMDNTIIAYANASGTTYTIPDSVTAIGDYAFFYCDSLESVTIPDSVTTIGSSAFYYCDSLTSVTTPDSVTTIGKKAFYECDSLESVTIGNSVTTIGEQAFKSCPSLTSVTIGNSVTTIGDYAFENCTSLKTVYCKPTTPPTGGRNMFYYNAAGRRIFVPASDDDSIIKAYKAKLSWSEYKDYIFEEE